MKNPKKSDFVWVEEQHCVSKECAKELHRKELLTKKEALVKRIKEIEKIRRKLRGEINAIDLELQAK